MPTIGGAVLTRGVHEAAEVADRLGDAGARLLDELQMA
jgi:hypothetical protein